MAGVVEVERLCIAGRDEVGRETPIVRDVSFSIDRGEVVALIGESGSGKTTIALSIMGYARAGCRITGGRVRVADTEVLALPPTALARFRGRIVTYIPQSAAAAFNPSRRLMAQVTEGAAIHGRMQRAKAESKAVALFRTLRLPYPETIGQRFPHQVSGGQLQRLIAAMALLLDPELVILDEPTTALDVTTQIEVLRAFKLAVRDSNTTALYISHDLAVVAQMADRVIVLKNGEIQEQGPTRRLLVSPAHEYTKSLLQAANPRASRLVPSANAEENERPVLRAESLVAGYGAPGRNGMPAVPVLHDISFEIRRGSVLGVIGESGCGKSTLARVIAGLVPAARGRLMLGDEVLPPTAAERTREQLRRVQIVFQTADTALNPAHTAHGIVARPLAFYHGLKGEAQSRRIAQLLDMVQLPAGTGERYPSELSGGQKQRLSLARALAAEPDLILCDEVTSSLDTVVGAAVLELLDELRRELGVAYMFISHNVAVIRAICDHVMVLYGGRTVEFGERKTMLNPPMHPYSDLLVSSVPELRIGWLDGISQAHLAEAAQPSDAATRATGCNFRNRCALRLHGTCDVLPPPLRRLSTGADVLCHRSEQELRTAQQDPILAPACEAQP